MNSRAGSIMLVVLMTATGALVHLGCDGQSSPDGQGQSRQRSADAGSLCAGHGIPGSICPFCHPEMIEEAGWCGGHGVPECVCTRCNSTLIALFKEVDDWCAEHGLPETQCLVCNPDVASRWLKIDPAYTDNSAGRDASKLGPATSPVEPTLEQGWCRGHGVPESVCTRCNAALIPKFKAAGDWCEGHGLPETQCTVCNPGVEARWAKLDPEYAGADAGDSGGVALVGDLPRNQRSPSVSCSTNSLQVRFATSEIAKKAGLKYTLVERRQVTATLECNAEIAFDGNRYARISSRVAGVVHTVNKDLGDRVETGEVMAVVDSSELSAAWAELLQTRALLEWAHTNHERIHGLVEQGIATEQDDMEAEAKLEADRVATAKARQALRSLGLTDAQIEAPEEPGGTHSLLPVTAPFAGIVIDRLAVMGEAINAYQPLFTIADTSTMWAMLDVYDADLFKVRVGQQILFDVAGLAGERFAGPITWISARVDPTTRTLKARAELDNPNGLLRANMFGRAVVTIRDSELMVVVPKSAVQWEGCCNVVFVRKSDQLFLPRKVRLGYSTDDYYEVLEGVNPGDEIVTQGSFLLKTEILKGSIGQGCCEVGQGKK
ncbi:MAG: efflux RND transporter periplasmic adaptor subunit [Planctomycetota bacterium]|nr:efflux RND transporter periplasmic adaptor subunit [Planctomycetota bacterium]